VAIDPAKAKALELAPITVDVERGRLRFFAAAIGETDPVYSDLNAAYVAGHADLPVPPTFFFSLELEAPDALGYLTELGVDLRRVLHGEQSFAYHSIVHAGDKLTLRPRIVDAYRKKGGALEFLVKKTDITRDGELVAEATAVIVVRNPEVAK
jgi:MaoC dehydratase-like protein